MKEISPFVVAMEMFKKNISINDRFHLVRNNSKFGIKQLSEIDRNSVYNSPFYCRTDSYPSIAFGWNKSNNCVVLFPNHEYFIRIHKQETGYLDDHFKYINLPEIKEDDIFQLTLEYGISKVELSDELYEFIFGE